ncbi:MAG TPA: GNAT family N-acetyltransferase [Blastococcus sp.]
MPADRLVHLVDPAQWRAALASGALRPPSLESAGFVHLSTPDQVHLPAGFLYPGRRDMVLLVVDPARLTDPLRWEPGDPDDPAGMLFPHLYGPLPVTAVVAVVPYRPPTPFRLPAAGDVLGRALALSVSVPVRRAAEVGDVPGGVAVLDARYPHSREDNRLLLTEPVDADTVERTTAEVSAAALLPHRSAALRWPGADAVGRELAGRGWQVEALQVMALQLKAPQLKALQANVRPAAPSGDGNRAEVVAQEEVHPLWNRSWRALLAGSGSDLDAVVGQLLAREHRNDRVVAVTDLAVREEGRVVAAAQLRIDGATAAVDSVLTDTAARGRGYGDALLAGAVDLAAEAGCDLVVLEAAADDWPREWYARRGFEVVGTVFEVVRPA